MQINPSNPINPFNIEITGDHFYIHETTPQKAESALTTLKKIEYLIRNHLNYNAEHPDEFTGLSKEEVYEVLRQKANEIRNNYVEEQSQRNRVARFIFSEEKPINETLIKIENLDAPIFPLLCKDLPPKVLEQMGIQDLSTMSRVNRQGNELGQKAILAEIQKLGYEGTNYDEALAYLKGLKSELNDLWLLGFNPSFFIMENMEKAEAFSTYIFGGDIEKQEHMEFVLEKLKNLSNEKLITLCADANFYKDGYNKIRKFLSLNFDSTTPLKVDKDHKQARALCQAVALEDKDILKLLLRMGVDPDSEFENQTALDFAKETGNTDCIEILTEALKKPE